MMPFIAPDDIVTIVPYQQKTPEIGDIAIFMHDKTEKIFIHRIIKKKNGRFLFKGDNRFSSDGFIGPNDILGQVGSVRRKNKNIILGINYGNQIVALLSKWNLIKIFFSGIKKICGTKFAFNFINVINSQRH